MQDIKELENGDFLHIFGIPKFAMQEMLPSFVDLHWKNPGKWILNPFGHLMLTLCFFKYYLPDLTLGLIFGVKRTTAQSYRKSGIDALYDLMKSDISLQTMQWRKDNGFHSSTGFYVSMVIDGSEQKCCDSENPFLNMEFYSGKKGQPSINILVGASPFGNKILYVSDSYAGCYKDEALIRMESGAGQKMPYNSALHEDETVLGDAGFKGLWDYGAIWTPPDNACELRSSLLPVRIRIENVFSTLKRFWSLAMKIRIPIDKKDDWGYILEEHQKKWIVGCAFINRNYIKY